MEDTVTLPIPLILLIASGVQCRQEPKEVGKVIRRSTPAALHLLSSEQAGFNPVLLYLPVISGPLD